MCCAFITIFNSRLGRCAAFLLTKLGNRPKKTVAFMHGKQYSTVKNRQRNHRYLKERKKFAQMLNSEKNASTILREMRLYGGSISFSVLSHFLAEFLPAWFLKVAQPPPSFLDNMLNSNNVFLFIS